MGARFDRLRCEVFQNLFLSPMNTGFVRPAIAIVPTACGMRRRGPAEEQSDDEARTSLVPDQREGKTEVIKQ